jgi:hypothetical protein
VLLKISRQGDRLDLGVAKTFRVRVVTLVWVLVQIILFLLLIASILAYRIINRLKKDASGLLASSVE